QVVPEMIRLARPGGWVEILEGDACLTSNGSVTNRVARALNNFMTSKGINPKIGKEFPRIFEKTNAFSEIKYEEKSITLGNKGGKTGKETLHCYVSGLNSSRGILAASMNVTPEHYDALLETILI
ncbi:11477_t:CDS:2, partial [Ambispora leptoticha]